MELLELQAQVNGFISYDICSYIWTFPFGPSVFGSPVVCIICSKDARLLLTLTSPHAHISSSFEAKRVLACLLRILKQWITCVYLRSK